MKFIIDENYEGTRLDKFIRKNYKNIALSQIYKMLRNGKIKVNGKKRKQDYRFLLEDVVEIFNEEYIEKNDFITLDENEKKLLKDIIVFEDEEVLIINKPANMVIHKGSKHDYGLVEMYKSYYKNNNFAFANRIDKSTSGLVIAAKTVKSLREITTLIREDKTDKKYYVLVKGIVQKKEFTIENYLKKDDTKVKTDNDEGKLSKTIFKLIDRNDKYSILEATLITGRTHQIRVQLSDAGYPIVGDFKYGYKTGKIMYLFSHRLIIKDRNMDINLNIPDYFIDKIK